MSITTDTVAVNNKSCVAFLVFGFNKNDFSQCVNLFSVNHISAVFKHNRDKLVSNITECKNFLFSNTRKVIVESTTVDNVLAGFLDVSGIINDNGRVTCTCTDSLFTRRKHCSYNTGTAGANEQTN